MLQVEFDSEAAEVAVKKRVLRWLFAKNTEYRITFLREILSLRKFNSDELVSRLESVGFRVSPRSVRALLGQLPTSLGVVSVGGEPGKRVYEVRSEYEGVIREIIDEVGSIYTTGGKD